MCSNYTVEKKAIKYTFEGYANIGIKPKYTKDYIDCFENISEIYDLIFIDSNFSTRLGLLRNIISVKNISNLAEVFDDDLVKVLHSNYQIYLRENIKQYIEVKNKTIELMNSLVIKATEKFEEQQKIYQKVAAGLATYIFMVILGRIFLKSSDKLFTIEIASITTILIVFSFIYLQFSKRLVDSSKQKILSRLESLKEQYKNILHNSELSDIFDKRMIDNSFDDNDVFLSHITYIVILGFILLVMWLGVLISDPSAFLSTVASLHKIHYVIYFS